MIVLSWDGLESDSTETCSVSESEHGIQVESTVHGAFGDCRYTLVADDHWQFRSLFLVLGPRSLRIKFDGTVSQGPRPLTGPERDSRRYSLSALIDDLSGSKSVAEAFILSADIFQDAADLLLLETRGWLGGGKWVIRRLGQSDHELATRLRSWAADPKRDPRSLITLAHEVLEISGGYLQDGFIRGRANDSTSKAAAVPSVAKPSSR